VLICDKCGEDRRVCLQKKARGCVGMWGEGHVRVCVFERSVRDVRKGGGTFRGSGMVVCVFVCVTGGEHLRGTQLIEDIDRSTIVAFVATTILLAMGCMCARACCVCA